MEKILKPDWTSKGQIFLETGHVKNMVLDLRREDLNLDRDQGRHNPMPRIIFQYEPNSM